MPMRDEFAVAECPQCGGEVRIPILSWKSTHNKIIGETSYHLEYGTPKCMKRCLLTDDEKKHLEITDHRWEDW